MGRRSKKKAPVARPKALVLPAGKISGGAGSPALKKANRQSTPTGVPLGNHDWILALLLLVATILAYQPVWHAGFIWDDDAHITKPELRSLSGLARIWMQLGATQQYYPLVHSIFWVEHRLWGDS